jgi:imidazolonepropionase-like amidohydrolase
MKNLLAILTAVLLISTTSIAQSKLITNVTIHHGNGEVTENGSIGFDKNGIIDFVGNKATMQYEETIDGKKQHAYPGFIAPNSTLGLTEIEAVRSTVDEREIGHFNPNIRSQIGYNTDSKILPTVTANGVLTAQITPRGGRISGLSSIMKLSAENWEDATIVKDDGLHLNWPAEFVRRGWWAEPSGISTNEKYEKQVAEIYTYYEQVVAHKNSSGNDIRLSAAARILDGKSTLYIHANSALQIIDAIQFKNKFGVSKMVLIGAKDALPIANLIKEADVPVLLSRVHDLPSTDDASIDAPFSLAAKLIEKGILVGLQNAGDMERMQTRNLAFLAGTLTAFGVSKEAALQTITLNNAVIMGVSDKLGSIEAGKHATFFLCQGSALEMKEQIITLVFIQGKEVDLGANHQKVLYERYK